MSPLPLNSTCWVFKHFFVYFCFVCGVLYHCLCHRLKKVLPHKGAHTPDLWVRPHILLLGRSLEGEKGSRDQQLWLPAAAAGARLGWSMSPSHKSPSTPAQPATPSLSQILWPAVQGRFRQLHPGWLFEEEITWEWSFCTSGLRSATVAAKPEVLDELELKLLLFKLGTALFRLILPLFWQVVLFTCDKRTVNFVHTTHATQIFSDPYQLVKYPGAHIFDSQVTTSGQVTIS